MITVVRLLLPVIDSEGTGDRQHAGHHQGALDPGGDAPKGSQVHAARVLKAPARLESPWAWRACGPTGCTAAGAVMSWGSVRARSAADPPFPTTAARLQAGDRWPETASGPPRCRPPGRALGASRHAWDQIEGV